MLLDHSLFGPTTVKELSETTGNDGDVPYERVVQEVQPPRDPSYNPIFQTMLVMLENPLTAIQQAALALTPASVHNGTSKVDLTCIMWEDGNRFTGTVEYCSDLFDPDSIERLVGHFRVLCDSIAADSNRQLNSLPLLTGGEYQQLVCGWNDTDKPYSSEKLIHQLFEERAALLPDAPAAEFQDERLSYQEVNERANQLANHLLSLDVSPGVPVAISVERSLDMVVGLMGIVKSGGYYVPVDPHWPVARMQQVMSNLDIAYIVTQHPLLGLVAELKEVHPKLDHVVCLDEVVVGEPALDLIQADGHLWTGQHIREHSTAA